MSKFEFKPLVLAFIFLIVFIIIILFEMTIQDKHHGTLLVPMLFWLALAQGSVTLVAAADLAKGQWITPLKKHLLSVYPFILLIAVLFLLLGRQMHIYHWTEEKGGLWFNEWSFLIRNFVLLVASFILANKFAIASLAEHPKKNLWAALYVLSFVVSQSLVGFDWVMSLEYPWISTLFGGYFFIEATYLGLATAAIICFFLSRGLGGTEADVMKKTLRDVATFMFGFSLFWVGMFFAQFLTIWYGNIPEEVSFTTRRLASPVLKQMARYVLGALFFVPFITLLSRKIKSNAPMVAILALIIMSGVLVERLFFLMPHISIHPGIALLEFILLMGLVVLLIRQREHVFTFKI